MNGALEAFRSHREVNSGIGKRGKNGLKGKDFECDRHRDSGSDGGVSRDWLSFPSVREGRKKKGGKPDVGGKLG